MPSSLTPLKKSYKKFKSVIWATLIFSFCVNALLFAGPLYMLQIYDRVLASRNESTLLMLSLIGLFVLCMFGIMEFVRSRLLVSAGLEFDKVLTNGIFERAVKAQLAKPNSGAKYILSDVDKIRDFIAGQGILTFFDALWVPMFIGLCFLFHPALGMIALGGAITIFILAFANDFLTRKKLKAANSSAQEANHFATAALQNADVIRPMGMGKQLDKLWIDRHRETLDLQSNASNKAGGIMAISKFVRMTLQSSVLGVGAYLAILQEITPGVMIAASIIMGRALTPVEQSVAQWKQFVASRQAHERLSAMFDTVPADEERIELPEAKGQILVEQLHANAPGSDEPILKDVNFSVEAGEIYSIVGPSGAGKSTLIRCLVGAIPAANGSVRFDGAEIQHWNSDQLGETLGYLPQEVKLFSGSVAQNISRFSSNDEGDVIDVSKLADVHDMILRLSNSYETQIGDSGHQLSGGQRQRIGLARALYGTPKIIVLDEPNANLDSVGEQALVTAIKKFKEMGSTVIVSTHKSNLMAISDKIMLLNEGTVHSVSTPKEFFKLASTSPSSTQSPAIATVSG